MAKAYAHEVRVLRQLLASQAQALAKQRDGYASGKAALLRGDGKAAVAAFRHHIRRLATSYSARVGLAAALAHAGRRAAAARTFAEVGLVGDLDGLCDLAWEVLGAEVLLETKAHELYDAGDLPRALMLARRTDAHLLVARTQAKLGRVARALAAARRAHNGETWFTVTAATVLIEQGEPEAAAGLFGELAKSYPPSWSDDGGKARQTLGWAGLALIRFRAGEYTQALAAVKKARAVLPADEGALLIEVASLAALGFAERAKRALAAIEGHHPLRDLAWGGLRRSELETALTGRPQRRRAALEQATLAFEEGSSRDDEPARLRLREAIASYGAALGTRPPACEVALTGMLRWAVAHAWLGERAPAVAVASQLLEIDRDNQSALRVIAWADSGARAAKAYRAAGLGSQLYGALVPTTRSLAAFRALPARDALTPIRRSLRARAEQLVDYGAYAAALDVYDALPLAAFDPARYLAAHAASELGARARAWRFLAPYLEAPYEQLLDAWWLGKKVAPAAKRQWVKKTFEETLEVGGLVGGHRARPTPDRKGLAQRALHAKAFAAERAGRFDEALARYLAALVVRADARVAGDAADLLVHRGELMRADAWFAIAKAQLGDLAPPLRQGQQLAKLAWRYLQEGQHARAATIAARAVELTQLPSDYHTLAKARLGAGDPAGARAALSAGLLLDPSHDELRAMRAELSMLVPNQRRNRRS